MRPPPEGISAAGPLALWVTDAEHAPALVLTSSSAELPTKIELEHVDPMRVRVVTPAGAPVSGAVLEQVMDVPNNALADMWEPQAARVLRRTFETGPDGVITVAGWRGRMVLRASSPDARSEAWIGEPRPELELVLHPAFDLTGSVAYPAGSLEGPQRVTCSVVRGAQTQQLAVTSVEGGRFGPLRIPCLEADGFVVRLEGWNAEIREQRIGSQEPDAVVHVDFDAVPGQDIWAVAEDPEGEPILDATIRARWERDGSFVEAFGWAREDGYVLIRGVPRCTGFLLGEAEGYVAEPRGPIPFPMDPPVTYFLSMFPGREVRGVVTHDGRPVEDFEIVWWDWDHHYHVVHTFRERADGSFTIDTRSGATTTLVASAEGLGPSREALVPPDSANPVELVLGELVRGRARAIDASTGQGIAGATVQVFVAADLGPVSPLAAPMRSSSTGEFASLDLPVGRSRVRFQAPGYAVHWEDVFGEPGRTVELGSIALGRPRDLEVRLLSSEPIDATAYALHGFGADPIPYRAFDPDGRTVVVQTSPGLYILHVTGPQPARVWAELDDSRTWRLDIPVGEGRTLVATVNPGERSLDDLWVRLQVPSPTGPSIEYLSQLDDQGRAEFTGLPAGSYIIHVTPSFGTAIASTSGRIGESEEVHEVQLTLFDQAWPIVVTTPDGEPASGAVVKVRDTVTHTTVSCTLDAQGLGSVAGLEPDRTYAAFVRHADLGLDPEVPVDMPATPSNPIELVFDPTHTVELLLSDGAHPFAGARCTLSDTESIWPVLASTTSEAGTGLVRWTNLGPGDYRVKIEHPSLWTEDHTVPATPPGSPIRIEVKRLGDLRVELHSQSGQSTGGLAVELTSLELGVPVGDWIEAGRVLAPQGLRTDAQGVVALKGLPRGPYRLGATGVEMTVEVIAGEANVVDVPVP